MIDHVHANHPFCCYYCDTCTEFDNIIKHSVKNHSLDVLKIKHSELNEKNGIYGYRSHNFNIIPRELDSTGKKIETDTTLDSLKLHIVLDKSSDITTISSPLHKRMKPSDSPVHDCINENHETLAKEDVDFQEMDYSDDGDFENEDEKHPLDLVPSVLETMNNHGKVDIYGYNFTKCWLLPHFRWKL